MGNPWVGQSLGNPWVGQSVRRPWVDHCIERSGCHKKWRDHMPGGGEQHYQVLCFLFEVDSGGTEKNWLLTT